MVNFFEQQDKARSTTKVLVALFGIAVCVLLLLTNLLLMVCLALLAPEDYPQVINPSFDFGTMSLPWGTMAALSLAVLGAIGVAIALKWSEFRQGGQAVARALGGQLLTTGTANSEQLTLLNIVEEMAIASGLPAPPVYLLPEQGINAFAAGFSPADAVVGVTEGCLVQLTRDELQGVIAHEFSHILNGDMRLNLKLITLLHGIQCIGLAGYFLLRVSGGARSRSSNEKVNPLPFLGLGLIVLGYSGVFFGGLIKAAVSRQREFLADASAVQFTRNPSGIAGALTKIANATEHSTLTSPKAPEFSHVFFADALVRFKGWMATHPPLAERIARLGGGRVEVASSAKLSASLDVEAGVQLTASAQGVFSAKASPMEAVSSSLLLVPLLEQALRQANTAPEFCYAVLLQPSSSEQQALLQSELCAESYLQVSTLAKALASYSKSKKIQLLQLMVPNLKQLSQGEWQRCFLLCQALIAADGQEDLLEWCVLNWLEQCVASQFSPERLHQRDSCHRLLQIQTPVLNLLGVCAHLAPHREKAWQSFQAGLTSLALPKAMELPEANFKKLSADLQVLMHAAPAVKQQIWQALCQVVKHDGLVSEDESLLLQVFQLLLEIPLNSQEIAALLH